MMWRALHGSDLDQLEPGFQMSFPAHIRFGVEHVERRSGSSRARSFASSRKAIQVKDSREFRSSARSAKMKAGRIRGYAHSVARERRLRS
jgi:hypothetical protein